MFYFALTRDRAKITELGLDEVVPRWRKARGRAPGITTKEVLEPLAGAEGLGGEPVLPFN